MDDQKETIMQTFSPQAVIERLQNIVGRSYVLTDDQSTRQYRQGRRFGEESACCGPARAMASVAGCN